MPRPPVFLETTCAADGVRGYRSDHHVKEGSHGDEVKGQGFKDEVAGFKAAAVAHAEDGEGSVGAVAGVAGKEKGNDQRSSRDGKNIACGNAKAGIGFNDHNEGNSGNHGAAGAAEGGEKGNGYGVGAAANA